MPEILAFWTKTPRSDMHVMQKGDSKKNKQQLLAIVIKQQMQQIKNKDETKKPELALLRDKNPSLTATIQILAGKFIPTAEPNGETWEETDQQQRSCLLSKVNHCATGWKSSASHSQPENRAAVELWVMHMQSLLLSQQCRITEPQLSHPH